MNDSPRPEGTLVLVVGPSGAGKDTLLNLARDALAGDDRFKFVRRIITRPAGGGENSAFAAEEAFQRLVAENRLALHWQAHGLFYGLPIIVDEWLANGDMVIANASRAILADARRRFPRLKIVNVVASPELIAHRLRSRGREAGDDIGQRLKRGGKLEAEGSDVVTVDNSGRPHVAAEHLVRILRSCALPVYAPRTVPTVRALLYLREVPTGTWHQGGDCGLPYLDKETSLRRPR
ncbi:phosphonate metabolism protein/1,5-bisphosphokinase (PRPP-forming) PhnN [Mesorhizobium tianshanense]|uniref:Ribose 1,5-bisphosphate phosphokinase PhnN n=1 Tax=Mesorhizobium tianshanense TaxID=39844 RepID=A0A562MQZ0_9HYPH|nr:phosphonate metabolism protein/1,5-bisphosphokinase (PRPP-forming) PhnN [Mesorhizobium tianshanense]TWI22279.1 ribose 1,5-bisphosphokinase [Mesorhizobium tianshanense]